MLDLSGSEIDVGDFVVHAGKSRNGISFGLVVSVSRYRCRVATFHKHKDGELFQVNSAFVVHSSQLQPFEQRRLTALSQELIQKEKKVKERNRIRKGG